MNLLCNVCKAPLDLPVYESPDERSITTMNKMAKGKTRVYFCGTCAHLQTAELPNVKEYYEQEYAINSTSDDEDQIYAVIDGKTVFRAEHQAAVVMSKVAWFPGCRVLDYGCAKAPTLKKVLAEHPEIEVYLFDVTDRYVPFWKRFPKPVSWAVHTPDPAWNKSLDVVLSFYALEHVSDLHAALSNVKLLLKPGGLFYFIVPNVYANTADFIVADHINHFSPASITVLLAKNGFSEIDIDANVHDAAFVVTAQFTSTPYEVNPLRAHSSELCSGVSERSDSFFLTDRRIPRSSASESFNASGFGAVAMYEKTVLEMATFWGGISHQIRSFEAGMKSGDRLGIYGAGFYGNLISAQLARPQDVVCFVDQNPHLQGLSIGGKPVIAPPQLPGEVTHILVGLNPRKARSIIESIPGWKDRRVSFGYL